MNRALNSRSFLPVKAIFIVVIVSAVTGGFTLGYFVGKGGYSPQPVSSLKQTVSDPASHASPADRNSDTRSEPSSSPATSAQAGSPEEKQASVVPVSSEAVSAKAETRTEKKEEADKVVSDEPAPATEKKVLYTVQAGAFRRWKEAVALKNNLAAGGIDASIRKEAGPKGVLLFKVRAGEFERKKEAEVFALKLQKEFGLNSISMIKK